MKQRVVRPKMAAFNQGQVPTITCFNKATVSLGVPFPKLVAALQTFLDKYFVPVWGTPAKLVVGKGFQKGAWAIAFLDTADVADALGYHDLTPAGLPFSKIFVQTTLQDGQKVSVTACHELCEMLIDPAINLAANDPTGAFYAYEVCDACEEEEFAVNGVPMSDFVYPAWFEGFRKPGSVQFDYLKKVRQPFEILAGGYMPIYRDGTWSQIFGSAEKAERFAREDRRGHRTTARALRRILEPSIPGTP
jgi:hypothetical protein